jgi:hypothetical protein
LPKEPLPFAEWQSSFPHLTVSIYDEVKAPLDGGRVTSWGFAIFAICLSMNWGAIRLIAFNTLLRPGRISSLPASMPEIARLSAIEYSKFRFEVVVIEPGLSLVALSGEPQVVDDFGPVVICRPLNRRHAPAF